MEWVVRNYRWLLIAAPVVIVIALVATFTRRSELPIRTEKAAREMIMNTISTNGKMEPQDNFEAHALAPTRVKKILVKEGDKVKAGQMIVQLDDVDARAQAAKAQAQLRAAQAQLAAVR